MNKENCALKLVDKIILRNILLRILDRCEVSCLITEVADGARGGMVSI